MVSVRRREIARERRSRILWITGIAFVWRVVELAILKGNSLEGGGRRGLEKQLEVGVRVWKKKEKKG